MSRPQLLQPMDAQPQQPRQDAHVPCAAADLLTQKAICQKLGISTWTWHRWVKAGRTPQRVDLPGHPRWRRDEIEVFAGQPAAGRYFRSVTRHGRQSAARTA